MKFPVPSAKTITGGTILGGSIIGPSTVAGLRGDEINAIALENKELSDENLRIIEEKDNWQQSFNRQRDHSIWVLDVKEKEIQELSRQVEIYEKYVKKSNAKLEKYRSELKKKEELIEDLNFELTETTRDNMKVSAYASYLKGVLNHFTKDDPIGSKSE